MNDGFSIGDFEDGDTLYWTISSNNSDTTAFINASPYSATIPENGSSSGEISLTESQSVYVGAQTATLGMLDATVSLTCTLVEPADVLQSLEIAPVGGSPIALTPTFDPDTTSYSAEVPFSIALVEVEAVAELSDSLVAFAGGGASGTGSLGTSLELDPGLNMIEIIVQHSSSSAPTVYSLTITRQPPEPILNYVSPSRGSVAGGNQVSIGGDGFTSPLTVTFGGLVADIVSVENDTIVVTAPPHAAGSVEVVVTTDMGTDSKLGGYLYEEELTIVPSDGTTLPAGTIGSPYSFIGIDVSGNTEPVTFESNGLPDGLSIDTMTGAISGMPTEAGSFDVEVKAHEGGLRRAIVPTRDVSATYHLTIGQPGDLELSVSGGDLANAMPSEPYEQRFVASGGTGPYEFKHVSGDLPMGLTLNSDGTLIGRLADDAELSSFTFKVEVKDNVDATGTKQFTLDVVKRQVTAADMERPPVAPGATPTPVKLTEGATGGPFTDAAVVSVEPAGAGTARISMGEFAAAGPAVAPTSFYLHFKPSPTFSGTAKVHYTLTSHIGTSSPATVTFKLSADPAKVAEEIDHLVGNFVTSRQSLIANGVNQPGLRDRRAMASGASPGTVNVTPNGNSVTMNFASSSAQLQSWGEAADAAGSLATPETTPLNFWIDGTGTLHLREDGGDEHWGSFGLLSMGGDYLVNENLLAGLAVHFDFMRDLSDTSAVEGTGILAGPYVSAEIVDNVFFDASLLYGRSWNDVELGSFSGDFETERFLARAQLEGQWAINDALTFRPNVAAFYLREDVGDYTVTDGGTDITIDGFVSQQFRLSAGGQFDYTMVLDTGLVVVPFIGADLGLAAINGDALTDNAFGTLSTGFSLSGTGNWTVTGGLDLNIDTTGFRSATGRLGVTGGF